MPRSDDDSGSFFDDEETTVLDGTPLVDEFATPETMPRCQECGRVVFFDDWTPAASFVAEGLFSDDRCVRSKVDARATWWWCGERRKLVYFVPT